MSGCSQESEVSARVLWLAGQQMTKSADKMGMSTTAAIIDMARILQKALHTRGGSFPSIFTTSTSRPRCLSNDGPSSYNLSARI